MLVFCMRALFLAWLLYVVAYALQLTGVLIEQSGIIISLAMIVILFYFVLVVGRTLFAVEEVLEISDKLYIKMLFGEKRVYKLEQIQELKITGGSRRSTSLYIEICMQNGQEWVFKSTDYPRQHLKTFFLNRNFVCRKEEDDQIVIAPPQTSDPAS